MTLKQYVGLFYVHNWTKIISCYGIGRNQISVIKDNFQVYFRQIDLKPDRNRKWKNKPDSRSVPTVYDITKNWQFNKIGGLNIGL